MSKIKLVNKGLYYLKKIGLENSRLYDRIYFLRVKEWCDDTITRLYGNVTPTRREELKKGMKEAFLKFHWAPSEYFHFHYEQLTDADRATFMSEYDKNCYVEKVNSAEHSKIFQDKWQTYQRFKDYFKREAILVKGKADLNADEVKKFIGKHNSFVMKAVLDYGGHGIHPIIAQNADEALKEAGKVLQKYNTNFILEELIPQAEGMAQFHPQSVNSIRIYTFNDGRKVHIIMPLMRCGMGASFVDNISSGGLTSLIDPETGIITSSIKNKTHLIDKHPDTGAQLVGAQIPRWEEAVNMIKELATIIPEVRYVGWDLALTDNGWVMIEGNDQGQVSGGQSMMKRGIKPELERLRLSLQKK